MTNLYQDLSTAWTTKNTENPNGNQERLCPKRTHWHHWEGQHEVHLMRFIAVLKRWPSLSLHGKALCNNDHSFPFTGDIRILSEKAIILQGTDNNRSIPNHGTTSGTTPMAKILWEEIHRSFQVTLNWVRQLLERLGVRLLDQHNKNLLCKN